MHCGAALFRGWDHGGDRDVFVKAKHSRQTFYFSNTLFMVYESILSQQITVCVCQLSFGPQL